MSLAVNSWDSTWMEVQNTLHIFICCVPGPALRREDFAFCAGAAHHSFAVRIFVQDGNHQAPREVQRNREPFSGCAGKPL